jgi:Domain of unknown function (DUF6817)/Activator of Hsp90 ATPase homolog 1-like protein
VTEPLRLSFDVECPAEHAFRMWTAEIGRWWPADHSVSGEAGLAVVLEPWVGGRIFERTAGGTEHDWGEVTVWEPPRRLGYLWHLRRDRADATEVDVTFVANGSHTRVEIEHRGWERLGAQGPEWREATRGGWATLLPHFLLAIRRPAAEEFLRSRGASEIPHPGGTLYAHLGRVGDLLATWGAAPDLQLAGLCHAAYGTDGFAVALLDVRDRALLVDAIGTAAEALVYRYGSCDRSLVYPNLGGPAPVRFTDRFTGTADEPGLGELRAFLELTAANELDVLTHNEELMQRYGASLLDLFGRCRNLLTDNAWRAVEQSLKR